MKAYIGCKIIKAQPMTLSEFNEKSEKNIVPATMEEEGYEVVYPDGYSSWSPKSVFENAYREISESERDLISINDFEGNEEGPLCGCL